MWRQSSEIHFKTKCIWKMKFLHVAPLVSTSRHYNTRGTRLSLIYYLFFVYGYMYTIPIQIKRSYKLYSLFANDTKMFQCVQPVQTK